MTIKPIFTSAVHANYNGMRFPLNTYTYVFEPKYWNNIAKRINVMLIKLENEIKSENQTTSNSMVLPWLNDLDRLILVCRNILGNLRKPILAHVNDKTFEFLMEVQRFDFMSVHYFCDRMQKFLTKLKRYQIQMNDNTLLSIEEYNCWFKLLNNNAAIIRQVKESKFIVNFRRILQKKWAKLYKIEESIKIIMSDLQKNLSWYLKNSTDDYEDLEKCCVNIHRLTRSELQKRFDFLDTRYKLLTGDIERIQKDTDSLINKLNKRITEATKMLRGTCCEIEKVLQNKPIFTKIKDLFTIRTK